MKNVEVVGLVTWEASNLLKKRGDKCTKCKSFASYTGLDKPTKTIISMYIQ